VIRDVWYDADDTVVRMRRYDDTTSAWVETDQAAYLWRGWLMLMELDVLSDCGGPGAPEPCIVRKYTWGLDLAGLNGAVSRFRFSTKPFDDATGFGYWGYRWYSPRLGRWLSRDPIEEAGGLHLYKYAKNRPGDRVDPIGKKTAGWGAFWPGNWPNTPPREPFGSCRDCSAVCSNCRGDCPGVTTCEADPETGEMAPCWCSCPDGAHVSPGNVMKFPGKVTAGYVIIICGGVAEGVHVRTNNICCRNQGHCEDTEECKADSAYYDCFMTFGIGVCASLPDPARQAECYSWLWSKVRLDDNFCNPDNGECSPGDRDKCLKKRKSLLKKLRELDEEAQRVAARRALAGRS
jgi:RHS repeat-associated protein